MAIISASEFSKLAGVSKAAISKAPESKIKKMPDGKIDTDNPINTVYLAEHGANKKKPETGIKKPASAAKKSKPKKPSLAKQKTKSDEDEDLDDELTDDEKKEMLDGVGDDMIEWTLRGKKAIALFREAGERKLSLALMERKKELLERSQFIAAVQGINKAIDDHLHRLPAKLGPVLFAIARQEGGTELAVIRELEKGMGDAIRRAVEDVARLAP